MPRRTRRRRRNKRGGKLSPTLLPVALLTILGGAFAVVWINAPDVHPTDPETLCPNDPDLIPHVHAIMLERNRRVHVITREFLPLDQTTVRQIQSALIDEIDGTPQYGKVQVYEVNYDPSTAFEPLLEMCNPGDGDDADDLYENRELARQRYRTMFREPLEEMLRARSNWSPDHTFSLFNSLNALARSALSDPQMRHATKSVTIVSDFVVPQNFEKGRFPGLTDDAERTPEPPTGTEWRSDFGGASVHMLYTRVKYFNIPDIQGPAHLKWWEKYFSDRNATVTEVTHVGASDN